MFQVCISYWNSSTLFLHEVKEHSIGLFYNCQWFLKNQELHENKSRKFTGNNHKFGVDSFVHESTQ